MRKTKCKSCNGVGYPMFNQCKDCQGTGEISVYTIQELRAGKVVAHRDGSKDDVKKLFQFVLNDFPGMNGDSSYYWVERRNWSASKQPPDNRPTQSVKIFLEEIEQEEEEKQQYATYHGLVNRHAGFKADPIIEKPEFKWGEEVEWSAYEGAGYVPGTYLCRNPDMPEEHLIFNEARLLHSVKIIRKPQKITLTLSQIAEKFNCKPEQIEILPYART